MPRNSFFANVSTEESTFNHLKNKTAATDSDSSSPESKKKSPRIAYTIKIDPVIRQSIKDWAVAHDVTISSVIESLARKYLGNLKKEDIQL